MPSEQLFDLSSINLAARVADRADIARFNPHRGLMALLDGIIWHDEAFDFGVAIKHTRADEFWVPGHIPGNPLMPGVLMVEAAAQLSSWMYYKRSKATWFAGFTHINEVTFRGRVVPGDDLILLTSCVRYSIKRFITNVQGLVNGQIVFDGRITGMGFPNMGNPVREATSAETAGR